MRAVETRTRLEQLQELERRTRHQLDHAKAHGDRGYAARLSTLSDRVADAIRDEGGTPMPSRFQPFKRTRKPARDFVAERLTVLGVTAHDVKVWAVSAGLEERVRRGRLRMALVDAYVHHHSEEATDGA